MGSFLDAVRAEGREASDAAGELWQGAKNHDWKSSSKKRFQRKHWGWWLGAVVVLVLVVLLAIYRDTIVSKFEPHKDAITGKTWTWVVPIVLLIIISFPPLFGHEIVLLVVGLIWGIWIGFGIACAGTFFGELACFFVFKYWLTDHANKIEEDSVIYGCIARLMREGGVGIIVLVRYSAVPGHIVTAIQSTVGMSIWIYCIAAIVSLPKQLAIVYLGVIFGDKAGPNSTPDSIAKQKRTSGAVLAVTIIVTLIAMYIVYMRARRIYPSVLAEWEARQAASELSGAPSSEYVKPNHPVQFASDEDEERGYEAPVGKRMSRSELLEPSERPFDLGGMGGGQGMGGGYGQSQGGYGQPQGGYGQPQGGYGGYEQPQYRQQQQYGGNGGYGGYGAQENDSARRVV